jgi:hypothetical protein
MSFSAWSFPNIGNSRCLKGWISDLNTCGSSFEVTVSFLAAVRASGLIKY